MVIGLGLLLRKKQQLRNKEVMEKDVVKKCFGWTHLSIIINVIWLRAIKGCCFVTPIVDCMITNFVCNFFQS